MDGQTGRRLLGLFIMLAVVGCGDGGGSAPRGNGATYDQQVRQALGDRDLSRRALTLINIGDRRRAARDLSGAEDTFSLARKACEAIEEPDQRAGMYGFLARGYARAEMKSQGRKAAASARSAADQVQGAEPQARALLRVGEAYAALQDRNQAVAALRDAEKLMPKIDEGKAQSVAKRSKVEILTVTASVYQQIGREEDVADRLRRALETAQSIEKPRTRCDAIAIIASMEKTLDRTGADETFRLAVAAAGEIPEDVSQGHALVNIAERRQQAGQYQAATELLAQAKSAADKVKSRSLRNELMDRIQKARQ